MNKEIEEMMLTVPQKIVAYDANPKGQHLYGEQRQQIAEALYNAGYRKVPDGAVVLTKEECDSKVILDEDHFLRVLDNEREKAHKETAKEIFKSFENAFSLYYPHGILTYEDFQNHFMYLAEKYGVEVEE